jgi:hypothetical protein
LPALSEPGGAAGGEGGETVGGNGGSAGTFAKAGRRGSAGAAASSGKGGSGPVISTGGAPAAAGGSRSAGGADTGIGEERGGTGETGETGGQLESAGMPSSIGGESNGGSSEGGAGGVAPAPDQDELEAETIERWNAIADQRDADVYNFHWTHDMFPHPTFAAMGEAEGYREFAFVLDDFLGTNFDFLAKERQFLTPYYYVTFSPSDVDLEVTWDELATDFSTMSYGDIPDAVQARLAEYAERMKAFE